MTIILLFLMPSVFICAFIMAHLYHRERPIPIVIIGLYAVLAICALHFISPVLWNVHPNSGNPREPFDLAVDSVSSLLASTIPISILVAGAYVALWRRRSRTAMNDEEIAELAHKLWVERGCPVGSPEEDWREAERIISKSGR